MLSAWTALLASVALASATRYGAGAYALVRYETNLPTLEPAKTTQLEVGPLIGLELEEPVFTIGTAYHPRLVATADSNPPQVLHQASLNAAWRTGPTFRLTANAYACYGTNDFSVPRPATCGGWAGPERTAAVPGLPPAWSSIGGIGALGPPPPGVQPVPYLHELKYVNANAVLGFVSRISQLVTISGNASYLAQGGADAPSRIIVPVQHGPSLWTSFEWAASRDDALATSLSGSYYSFRAYAPDGTVVPRADTWTAQALETWRHALGLQDRFRLGAGVGIIGDTLSQALRRTSAVGEAGIDLGLGESQVQLGLGARVAPFVDFVTGLAYQRADGVATLVWPLPPDWRLEASFSGGVALEGIQHGQVTATGRLTATWTIAQGVLLTFGTSSLLQEAGPDFSASTFRDWTVFAGIGFRQMGPL